MRRNRKSHGPRAVALAIALLLLFATGCGSSSAGLDVIDGAPAYDNSINKTLSAGMSSGMSFDGASESYDNSENPDDNLKSDRKLVRTAEIRIETKNYDAYSFWLEGYISELGGYLENTECIVSERGWDYVTDLPLESRTYTASVRIPEDKLDIFLNSIGDRDGGKIKYQSENIEDITIQYSDTEAHLESIRIEQQRLQELMAKAETVDEIISIEDRLSYLRYEIESYERQIRDYDSRVNYASVWIELSEVVNYTPQGRLGFIARCLDGIKENLKDVGEFFQDAGVYLFSHIPSFACLGAAIFVGYKINRKFKVLGRIKIRRKTKRQDGQNQDQD